MRAPWTSISMDDDCCRLGDAASDIETGTKAGVEAAGPELVEAFAARRHVNNCPGLTPFRRAICETLAPGSRLSATSRAFSRELQARRRAVPVITSTRRNSPAFVLAVKLELRLSSSLSIAALQITRASIIADSGPHCQCGSAATLTRHEWRSMLLDHPYKVGLLVRG